jgi:hypothetical protein
VRDCSAGVYEKPNDPFFDTNLAGPVEFIHLYNQRVLIVYFDVRLFVTNICSLRALDSKSDSFLVSSTAMGRRRWPEQEVAT